VSKGRSQRAPTPEAFAARRPTAALLDVVRDFHVEWDDGSTGTAGAMAIFVHTTGFGTGHQKLELLTAEDVVAISLEERRILARTGAPPAATIGDLLWSAPARTLRRLFARRGQPGAFRDR
jgi:hypothetical protein